MCAAPEAVVRDTYGIGKYIPDEGMRYYTYLAVNDGSACVGINFNLKKLPVKLNTTMKGRRSLLKLRTIEVQVLLDDMVLSGRTFIKAWNLCIAYNIAVPVLYYQNYTFLVLYTVHPQDNWDRRERRRAGVISIGCLA